MVGDGADTGHDIGIAGLHRTGGTTECDRGILQMDGTFTPRRSLPYGSEGIPYYDLSRRRLAWYHSTFIEGVAEAAATGAEVTHAGTGTVDGNLVTAGGRVLNVTALGPDPAAARERAYDAAQLITFGGRQIRTDIAARAVERTQQETR